MTENKAQEAGCLSHLTAELGMTSEEILGFIKPVAHQCPNINKFIRQSDDIASSIRNALKSADFDVVKSHCEDADWNAGDISGYFEELRTALEITRAWGQQWKDLAKELIKKHEKDVLENSIDA